jgi:hypothetical protein
VNHALKTHSIGSIYALSRGIAVASTSNHQQQKHVTAAVATAAAEQCHKSVTPWRRRCKMNLY